MNQLSSQRTEFLEILCRRFSLNSVPPKKPNFVKIGQYRAIYLKPSVRFVVSVVSKTQ